MAAIETEGLTKDFLVGFWRPRPYRALDTLSLSVAQGEVFGFLGPNGAGKSTTLKLLMQLIYPTSGEARILGKPAGDVQVRRRIGFLAENPYYYDYLTAEELLKYFARLFGYHGAEVTTRVARVLDEVAAFIAPGARPGAALRTMFRDAGKHKSPNAGWPEAAIAGALGLKLAGPRLYDGDLTDDHWMGDGRAGLTLFHQTCRRKTGECVFREGFQTLFGVGLRGITALNGEVIRPGDMDHVEFPVDPRRRPRGV